MPSKKRNCYCPTCKGELRNPKTVKKHSARVDAITTAQEAQKEYHDRTQLGGGGESDSDGASYENVNADGKVVNEELVRDVEMGVERPNKRRRIDENTVSH